MQMPPELLGRLKACRSVMLVFSKEFLVPRPGNRSLWQRVRLPVVEAGFSVAFKQRLIGSKIRIRGPYVKVFDWLYVPVLLSSLMWRVAALLLVFLVTVILGCGLGGWRVSQRIAALGEWQQALNAHMSQRWRRLRANKTSVVSRQKVLDQYHWLRTLPLTLAAIKIRRGRAHVSGVISEGDWRTMEKRVGRQRFAVLMPKHSTVAVLPSGVLQCKLVFRF